jgi:hypothetical protein
LNQQLSDIEISESLGISEIGEIVSKRLEPYKQAFLKQTLNETRYSEEFLRYAQENVGCELSSSIFLYGRQRDEFIKFLRVAIPPLAHAFTELPHPDDVTSRMVEKANAITL